MKGRSKHQNDKVKREVKRETLTIFLFSEPLHCSQIQNSALLFMIKCDPLPLTFDLDELMSDDKKSSIRHIYQPVL